MTVKMIFAGSAIAALSACSVPSSQSNHQNLSVAECRALAQETFRAGVLNYDLCPGYAPDGHKIELF